MLVSTGSMFVPIHPNTVGYTLPLALTFTMTL